MKNQKFYTYTGDRLSEEIIEFIQKDYLRSPVREVPRALNYKALRIAEKERKKRDRKRKEEAGLLGEVLEYLPDTSSTEFAIGSAVCVVVFFLFISFCCAPSVESEEEEKKTTKGNNNKTKKGEGKKNKKGETTKTEKIPTKDTKKSEPKNRKK